MKRILNIASVLCLLAVSLNLAAQKAKTGKGTGTPQVVSADKEKPPVIYSYIGHSDVRNGKLSKKVFDSLLKQGITAKDSMGNAYKVDGFMFSYGERNLYEDSVGKLIILTDMVAEYCPGDTLSLALKHNIFSRTKAGDTAYIDNVKVQTPAGQMAAKGIRLVLTK